MPRPPREKVSEYSAGGVVYRPVGGEYEVLAVNRARHTDWSLPKGHVEEGETREQAAVREVREETGIEARVVEAIGEIKYFYRRRDGTLVHKSVYYFLMEGLSHELAGPNWEVAESRWVPLGEVRNLLTYENDRGVTAMAEAMLAAADREEDQTGGG